MLWCSHFMLIEDTGVIGGDFGNITHENKEYDKPGIDIFVVIYLSDGRPVEAA